MSSERANILALILKNMVRDRYANNIVKNIPPIYGIDIKTTLAISKLTYEEIKDVCEEISLGVTEQEALDLLKQTDANQEVINFVLKRSTKKSLDGDYIITIEHDTGPNYYSEESFAGEHCCTKDVVTKYVVTSKGISHRLPVLVDLSNSVHYKARDVHIISTKGKDMKYFSVGSVDFREVSSVRRYCLDHDYETDNSYFYLYPTDCSVENGIISDYHTPCQPIMIPLIDKVTVKTPLGLVHVDRRIVLEHEHIPYWTDQNYASIKYGFDSEESPTSSDSDFNETPDPVEDSYPSDEDWWC